MFERVYADRSRGWDEDRDRSRGWDEDRDSSRGWVRDGSIRYKSMSKGCVLVRCLKGCMRIDREGGMKIGIDREGE